MKVKAYDSDLSYLKPYYFLASEAAEFHVWHWVGRELGSMPPLGKRHAENLAQSIFDYICVTSLGEARHARNKCADLTTNLPPAASRHDIYKRAHLYEPKQFLPKLSVLFNEGEWDSAFGGKAWGKAVDYALQWMSGEITTAMFIDHCVWLQHNTGVIFNKSVIYYDGSKDVFRELLDALRHSKTPAEFIGRFYVSRKLAVVLRELLGISPKINRRSMLDKGYRKIRWKGTENIEVYVKTDNDNTVNNLKVKKLAEHVQNVLLKYDIGGIKYE